MPHRAFDHIQVRCPMLGGPVTFGYCREVADGLPCHKALICFERQFPADEYFRRTLEPETFERCFTRPTGCRYEKILGALQDAQNAPNPPKQSPENHNDPDDLHDPDDPER